MQHLFVYDIPIQPYYAELYQMVSIRDCLN